MPERPFTQEDVERAPSLRGKYENPKVWLTPFERAVAQYQDLLQPDGALKEEALKPAPKTMPAGLTPPLPLSLVAADARSIEEEVLRARDEVRARHAANSVKPSADAPAAESGGLPPPEKEEGPATAPTVEERPREEETPRPTSPEALTAQIAKSPTPVPCGHCGWDQREFYNEPVYTEEDKLAFIRHFFGPSSRFYKTYELFDGGLTVTLRSRLQSEADLLENYVRQTLKTGETIGVGDFMARLQRYQIASSVHKIVDQAGTTILEFPELAKLEIKDASAVVEMDRLVFGSGQSAALFQIIAALWMDFERLYGYLASRSLQKGFWKAAAEDLS